MISSIIDKTKIPFLNKALDAYAQRHEVIAENIANISTPGYKTKRLKFEEYLNESMSGMALSGARTNERHIAFGKSSFDSSTTTIETENFGDVKASGMNDVNIDREMAELAKNQILSKFSTNMLADEFRSIHKSIKGEL